MPGPAPVERDSRGIVDPRLLRRRVAFTRHPPTPALEGLVDRFWAVRWDLPVGVAHRQEVLTHPAVNLSVGTPDARSGRTTPEARVTGVATDLLDRELAGRGWTVAMMSTVGGFGAFTHEPVSTLVGRVVGVDVVPGLDGRSLVAALTGAEPGSDPPTRPGEAADPRGRPSGAVDDDGTRRAPGRPAREAPGDGATIGRSASEPPDGEGAAKEESAREEVAREEAAREAARVGVLARALEAVLSAADPARVAQARDVAAVARIAETDRDVRRLDDLAARARVSPRALQRRFARHAGVSPTWVLRRYRLLEAAESVRDGERVVWSDVAYALGYADQAHLVRDFRAALGRTPEAYARNLRARADHDRDPGGGTPRI